MKFKAILFDFDGVIADTMEDNFLAWKKAFQNYGVKIKKEDYFILEGMKLVKLAETISEKYGLRNVPPLSLVHLKNTNYKENYSFKFYPKIPELISELKNKNIKLSLVTASPREKLNLTLSKEFLENFNEVITGDDTANGKPEPDPYLMAMKKLEVKPSECLVVENAPLGITAAKKAGAYCIAIATTLDKKYLYEADKILGSHEELYEEIFEGKEDNGFFEVESLAEICKEALQIAHKALEDIGNEGRIEVFDESVTDISTKGDRRISSELIKFFKKKEVPAILCSEESGRIKITENPKYLIAFDDIDGTDNYYRGNNLLPHCSVITIFDSTEPIFKNALIAGVIEHVSKKTWVAIRGRGCFLNGVKTNHSEKKVLNRRTLILIDHYANSSSISQLNLIYPVSWVKDFGSSAFHLAGISSGLFDGYVSRYQKAHELGAGYLLVKESGGFLADWTGVSLDMKKYDFNAVYDVIVASTSELGEELLSKLGG